MWGKNDMPEYKAALGVSFMMFINLFFIGLLLQYLGIVVFMGEGASKHKEVIFCIFFAFFGLNYFLFIRSDKYESIANELEKENKQKRKKKAILLWLYTILSFILPIVLLVLIKDKYYS